MSNGAAVCRGKTAQPLHTTSATSPAVPKGRCSDAPQNPRPAKEPIPAPGRGQSRAGPRAAAYQESHRVEAPHEAGGRGRARRGRPAAATLILLLLLLHAGGGAGPAQCSRRGGNGAAAPAAGQGLGVISFGAVSQARPLSRAKMRKNKAPCRPQEPS